MQSCWSTLPLWQLSIPSCSKRQCGMQFSTSQGFLFFVLICTNFMWSIMQCGIIHCHVIWNGALWCLHFIAACCNTALGCNAVWMGHLGINSFQCVLAVTGIFQCNKTFFTAVCVNPALMILIRNKQKMSFIPFHLCWVLILVRINWALCHLSQYLLYHVYCQQCFYFQGVPIPLHAPYSSEHAKVPVGSITMGLPINVDPKKLGEERKFKSVLSGYVYVITLIYKLSFVL